MFPNLLKLDSFYIILSFMAVYGSVSQPFKQNERDFNLLGEHLWSPEQWIGTTGLGILLACSRLKGYLGKKKVEKHWSEGKFISDVTQVGGGVQSLL